VRVNGTVLIVEDEALVALTMEEVLIEAGYFVCGVADTPDGALELARQHDPDLAVVDVRLASGGDGIVLAELLVAMGPITILFATANCAEVRQRARAGQGCLSKPFQAGWLLAALEAVQTGADVQIPGYFSLPFAPASA
jgi:CheY-like chemotaxis protein